VRGAGGANRAHPRLRLLSRDRQRRGGGARATRAHGPLPCADARARRGLARVEGGVCMPISEYLRNLRSKVGPTLLLVPSVTGLVFDDDGRVLLVRHSNGGVWVAPGGAIDPGETPQDALVREVWEETGLRVMPKRMCGVFGGPEFHVQYANGDEV